LDPPWSFCREGRGAVSRSSKVSVFAATAMVSVGTVGNDGGLGLSGSHVTEGLRTAGAIA
jgi:hypothetical protein